MAYTHNLKGTRSLVITHEVRARLREANWPTKRTRTREDDPNNTVRVTVTKIDPHSTSTNTRYSTEELRVRQHDPRFSSFGTWDASRPDWRNK